MTDISSNSQFGSYIRQARECKGLSRRQLVDLIGCTYESVRLWEHKNRRPDYSHLFNICAALNIDPSRLYDDSEASLTCMNGIMASEFMAASLIKNRCEISVYPEKKQIYLKKNFRQCLEHDIEISIDPEDHRGLLIKEKDRSKLRRCYYDADLVRELTDNTRTNGKLNFLILKDGSEEALWRGKLLPAIGTDSYLWKRPDKHTHLFDYDEYKAIIIKALRNESAGFLEYEEISQFFDIGYYITVSEKKYYGDMFWYHVLMSSYNMISEMKSVLRRSKRAEAEFSLDKEPKMNDLHAYGCRRSAEDECFSYLVVEDFISRLTLIEESILKLRYRNIDWFNCNDIGHGLKNLMKETIEKLKAKAEEYFGMDYISSILIF